MFGTISGEIVVNAPASVVWEVYGTLELAGVVEKGLPGIDKIEVVEGDGSTGTVLKIIFKPGVLAFPYYSEKFTKVDNEKMVKETEVVEGGYLEVGFTRYFVRLEIIEKDEKSCTTKATIEYDVKEDSAANVAFVSIEPLITIMNLAADHIVAKSN